MPSRDGPLFAPHVPLPIQLLLLHLIAWAVALLAAYLAHPYADLGAQGLILLQALAAWGGTIVLGLPRWWRWINAAFFPAVWLALQARLAPGWYLSAFALLALTQWGAIRSRVPLYLSGQVAEAELVRRLAAMPGARVLDLGCGTGSLLAHLARSTPTIRLYGVEAAPLLWLVSRLRLGRRARIRLADLWSEDLSRYDVVYAFLSPAPMPELWNKVRREMRPGTLFISNTFGVPGIEPDETVELGDPRQTRLLIWRMP